MPGRRTGGRKQRPKAQFKVVQQSYEDKEYEEKPKPVLVPVSVLKAKRHRGPLYRFGEDLPEDFSQKRNMLMYDDEAEDAELEQGGKVFFDDEVEEEFDQDFIKQMMFGNVADDDDEQELFGENAVPSSSGAAGGAGGPESQAAAEAARYPKHENMAGILEKQFEHMAAEFDFDEEIEEEDPRARGTLDVKQYAAALEEFVEEHAGTSYTSELPMKHRSLINQMKMMTHETGVFDTDRQGGVFMTTLLPDKARRINENYHDDIRELKELTAEMLRQRVDDDAAVHAHTRAAVAAAGAEAEGAASSDPPEGKQFVTIKDKRAQHDCETILSTYTTLFNHPNVIAAQKKKVRLPTAAGASKIARQEEKRMEKEAKIRRQQQQHLDPEAALETVVTAAAPVQAAGAAGGGARGVTRDNNAGGRRGGAAKEEADMDDADPEEEEGDDEGGSEGIMARARELGIDLSQRARDEGPEEKKLRRQLVKQLQRERREAKKQLKGVYKALAIETATTLPQQKQQKRMTSLSAAQHAK